MLIIYEVSLKVERSCADKYKLWLTGHIQDMLMFSGFNKADLYYIEQQTTSDSDHVEFVVTYSIDTIDSLNNYFEKHAESMRAEALKLFPNQFIATRRILQSLHHFDRA